MSVESSAVPTRPIGGAHTLLVAADAEHEARWAAWKARGAAHDLTTARRMRIVAVLALALLVLITLVRVAIS